MSELLVSIPTKAENMQLPDPFLLNYFQDEAERTFWIEGEIDEELHEVSKQIIRINREDKDIPVGERKPIKLLIDSNGGSAEDTMAFISLMELSKTPVWTINMGWCYSAAGLILMSGHKRFAVPRSKCLIHSGSITGMSGTYEQSTEAMKDYKNLVEQMKGLVLSKTAIDAKLYKKNSTKDWYIETGDMLKLGIVDEIVNDLDTIL